MYDGFVPTDRDNTPRLLLAFYIGVVIVFLALGVTYWNFQVVQHARFSGRAENNYQQTLALRAPRGVVFDRDGRVLVENRHSLNISLVRERVADLDQALVLLAKVTDVDLQVVRDVVEQNIARPKYLPIVIIRDASLGQVAARGRGRIPARGLRRCRHRARPHAR